MSFYSRVVFPCLCDFLLRQPFLAEYRRELLTTVCGDILEIGFGTGLNLPFYPPHVDRITAVDANAGMNRKAMQRIRGSTFEVNQSVLDCERLLL
jgi:predicted TPR repeat methyltransferase